MILVLAAVATAAFSSCLKPTNPVPEDDDYGIVGDFALTERSGETIRKTDLQGKVWIASFIFTNCAGPCPQVSGTMARLQKELEDKKDILLVSYTVDPERDSPSVLKKYAESFQADPKRWLFLTGKREDIYPLLENSFKVSAKPTEGPEKKPGFEIAHSTKLLVVDQKGHIRGYFDGVPVPGMPEDLPKLVNKINALLDPSFNREPAAERSALASRLNFPRNNAMLNATSALLLVLGYVSIRRRQITLHKACMLTALVVSALFLSSYVYYHFIVRGGEPTGFTGPKGPRFIYFAILISHIILAAIVAPLALFTAYQGITNNLAKHVRVARWTLPIWFYVSVTGVIVYWMLYHLYPAP